MKHQKFQIKEEAYEHDDQYKQFYALNSTNTTNSSNSNSSIGNTKSFNLRKINANRVYLNSLSDKNSHKATDEKENVDKQKKETQILNSEKCKFLELFHLKPDPKFTNVYNFTNKNPTPISSNLEETKLNTNLSLVDQIINSNSQLTLTQDNEKISKIDLYLNKFEIKNNNTNEIQTSIDNLKLNIPVKKYDCDDCTDLNTNLSCVYEYLFKIGGTSVSLECFQHVLFQLKHAKFMMNANMETTKKQIDTNSISDNDTHTTNSNSNSSLQFSQNNSKFEFIYAENFYWIVKIKKFYNNLYQLKFMRSTNSNNTNNNNNNNTNDTNNKNKQLDINNTSDMSVNIDELNTSDLNKNESSSPPTIKSPLSRTPSPTNAIINSTDTSSQHLLNNSISNASNYSWFFSNEKNSLLSSLLRKYLKPLGWSKKMGRQLKRPSLNIENDLFKLLVHFNDDFLLNSLKGHSEEEINFLNCTLNSSFLSKQYEYLNKLKENNWCELVDEHIPLLVHIVKIKRSIAGRLLIEFNSEEIWLYYLDIRVRPLGWAKSNKIFSYSNNDIMSDIISDDTDSSLLSIEQINQPINNADSVDKPKLQLHCYMECLYKNKFYVARIVELVEKDFSYFVIELDCANVNKNVKLIYYTGSNYQLANRMNSSNKFHSLFPCNWCSYNNLNLELPRDWPPDNPFDWNIYLKKVTNIKTEFTDLHLFNWSRNLTQLSEKFQLGMYLECVNEKNDICLAQIKAKIGHLLFLKVMDSNEDTIILPVDSMDLFPIGWCEMNNFYGAHEAKSNRYKYKIKPLVNCPMRSDLLKIPYLSPFNLMQNWCNKIYINTDYYCGPYFHIEKINNLPKSFGPGPIVFILTKILKMLISASDKPFKLLKVLQASRRNLNNLNNNSSPLVLKSKFMQRLRFKAKEKGKYNYRELEICTKQSHLDEYLNDLCIKLKCCNKMISLNKPNEEDKDSSCKISNCKIYKCCELCTLNYFSDWSDFLIEYLNNEHTSLTTSYAPVHPQITSNVKKKPNSSNNNTNNNIKTTKLNRAHDLKVNSYNENFSPIKTRFNVRQSMIFSMRQEQKHQQQLELKQQEQQKQLKLKKKAEEEQCQLHNNNNSNNHEKAKVIEKRKNILKSDFENENECAIKKRIESNEPIVKKPKKLSLIENEKKSQNSKSVNSNNENQMQHTSTRAASHSVSPTKPSGNQQTMSRSSVSYSNVSIQQNSLISNANMANMFNNHHHQNNQNTNNLRPNNINNPVNNIIVDNRASLSVNTNPIYWSASDVCKYLLSNKFDANLVYLIEEHEIDGQSFLMLDLPTIQNYMNLKLGPAIKLAHLVEKLKLVYFQQYKTDSTTTTNTNQSVTSPKSHISTTSSSSK